LIRAKLDFNHCIPFVFLLYKALLKDPIPKGLAGHKLVGSKP
tara:strand:- start:22 stop:147 length:126 start_codon:yes stop_codon:yes gene_type:complete